MHVLRAACFLLLLVSLAVPHGAQSQVTALSDSAQVSLITILPGTPVYTVFGHSAVRIYDPAQDLDVTFNYGTFDFGNPLTFAGQFAYGKLDYFLSVQSYPRAADYYWTIEERPLIEQVLMLSPAHRDALFAFLRTNALPENKYYRYDFFFDNCSTRIRDAFEEVMGDDLRFAPEPDPGQSLRRLLDPYLVERPMLHFGMDLGLGLPADRLATPRETMFLPDYLMEAFNHATVVIDGEAHPLVARTDTVYWSPERAALDPAWPWPSLLAWGLFVLGIVLTARDVRTGRTGRRLFDGLLFGLVGIAGLLLLFLWFVSLHAVTHGNLNLLWAWPTHLIAAVVLVRKGPGRGMRIYLIATALVALIVPLGWPFWPQDLPAAVLPLVLLLTVRSAGLAYVQETRRRGVGEPENPL